jgi:LacI family transcriptional regulator
MGGVPELETRLFEALLQFGYRNPGWHYSLRKPPFRYTKKWLQDCKVDGALVFMNAQPVAKILNTAGVPWVHIIPPKEVSHPSVMVDEHFIGCMGADFFLEKGFLRCAYFGFGTPWSDQRARSFRKRLREAGRECDILDIPGSLAIDWSMNPGAQKKLLQWVQKLGKGTAIMVGHDLMANHLVDLCRQHSIQVPRDIAVLGVGNHQMSCKLSPVPISSIDTGVPDVAMQAAQMLHDLIEGKQPDSPVKVPPIGVVERQSTELMVYGNDLVSRMIAYIREHACNGLTVPDLLDHFPISRRTLARRFEKYVGRSPAAEIRRVRLQEARILLAESDLSLTDIAHRCSFADLPHMDRAFRQAFGTSPGKLRRTASPG